MLAVSLCAANAAMAEPLRVGVSEHVYGDLAQQIGGPAISVVWLRPNPASPLPHLDLVICGCAGKDAWLRDATRRASGPPGLIEASPPSAGGRSEPEFPWYDPPTMEKLARRLEAELAHRIPREAPRIAANAAQAMAAFETLDRRIGEVARDYANSDVILADNLYRGITERLRFKIRDEDYLQTVEAGKPPSTSSLAGLKKALQRQTGGILLYDKDRAGPAVEELVAAAGDDGVPAVALRERLPKGLHYQQWMLRQVNAVHGALNEAAP